MPNDCWNHITITCKIVDDLTSLVTHNMTDESGEYHKNITILKKCPQGIRFDQITAWEPDYKWLENIVNNYPCWIKNEWYEEGGIAGVWIGSKSGIQSMEWEDLCIEEQYEIFDKHS